MLERRPQRAASWIPKGIFTESVEAVTRANALAETVIGLYKEGLVRQQGLWWNLETVEFATLSWVDWFNNRRLLQANGDMPPAETKSLYFQQLEGRLEAVLSQSSADNALKSPRDPPVCAAGWIRRG